MDRDTMARAREGGWLALIAWIALSATAGAVGAIAALLSHRNRRLAAWLLAPYLAWVSFAAILTWAMWRGNPGLL